MQQLLLMVLSVVLITKASAATTAATIAATTEASGPKEATYWITMSRKLRPGQPLNLNVQILFGADPVEVTVTIKDYSGKDTILTSTPTSVQPGDPQTITIDIPMNIRKPSEQRYRRSYRVTVQGVGQTVNFEERTSLTYEEKSFSIFIQTDKAVYKPRQTVKFRVLAMLPDMKVIRDEPMDIIIKDSKGNRIRQYLGVKDPNVYGVVELTFNLADGTPAGQWSIEATIMGTMETKTFEVDDYVLPRFEVEVKLPPFGLESDSILPITAKAMYTFGQPVTKATVELFVTSTVYSRDGPKGGINFTGTLDKKGEFSAEVSTKRLLGLVQEINKYYQSLNYRTFKVQANVTETDTGRKLSGESQIQYYNSPLTMKFLDISPNSFKPGLGYTGYMEVTKKDGSLFSAAEASKIRIHINVTYEVKLTPEELTTTTTTQRPSGEEPSTGGPMLEIARPGFWNPYPRTRTVLLTIPEPVQTVPETGWITIAFTIPPEAESVTIIAKAEEPYESDQARRYLSKSESPTASYLQLKVPTDMPKVGQAINVRAEATEMMTKLQYQVYSKGMLVDQGTISSGVAGGSMALDFSFTVSQAMAPSMTLLAFYVREENDEFVVDAVSLSVDGLFQKPVTIEFSQEKVKPGEPVDVIIKAAEGSLVYILVVDKSVQLLKSGNDITQDTVLEELVEYDYGSFYPWMRYMFICGWPSYYGGNDAASIFENAKVLVLTDGLVYRKMYDSKFPRPVPELAFGGAGSGGADGLVNKVTPAETVRKYFPENWLWEISFITPDSSGQVVISSTAPDTITTWLASVFSVHPTYGLSVGAESAELTTFRDMFVTLDLPLSIIRDEDYCFTATVFSYYEEELPVLLTLDKSDDFSNIHVRLDGNSVQVSKENVYYSYFLGYLEQNDAESVKFCFTPTVIGDIPIKVSALTNVQGLSDAVERKIRVKPEGVPRATSYPYLIDLSNGAWSQDVAISYPDNTVQGSERLTVSLAGNLLGPALENLDDLLKQPYGCGEQNMLNFAPNTYLIDFFYKTGLMTDETLQRLRNFMLIGYQREIKYEHRSTGGGFSAFGDGDKVASLWLTAFVTRCFAEAAEVDNKYNNSILALDMDIISRSAKWMITNQHKNGTFTEYGKVFHKEMQGGSAEGEALTAYTLIALHEASKVLPDEDKASLADSIRMATEFLERRGVSLSDPYDICITAYALHLVDSPFQDQLFNRLQSSAIVGGGMRYWERSDSVSKTLDRHAWSASADSISLEMTAYALLTYALRGIESTQGLPIVRWLTNQRGPNGGFISTQDTVVGLQALSTVAASLYSAEDIPLTVTVSYTGNDGPMSEDIKINKANEMLLQSVYIPYKNNLPTSISINAATDNGQNGQSSVVAEVVLNYNVQQETRAQIYEMSHRMAPHTHGFELFINIRTVSNEPSSMSILEVDIPAGHSPDTDSLTENKYISRVEVDGDKLVLYFETDVIDMTGVDVRVVMATTGGVLTKAQPRSYRVYNYYDSDQELTRTYVMQPAGFCDKVPDVGACPYRYV